MTQNGNRAKGTKNAAVFHKNETKGLRKNQNGTVLPPPAFIIQPLIVGVTPIGRKYELRLAKIAWCTLLYPRAKKETLFPAAEPR